MDEEGKSSESQENSQMQTHKSLEEGPSFPAKGKMECDDPWV